MLEWNQILHIAVEIYTLMKTYLMLAVARLRERSPLGDVSLYGWSPVVQVWIQLHKQNMFVFGLFPILLNQRPAPFCDMYFHKRSVFVVWVHELWQLYGSQKGEIKAINNSRLCHLTKVNKIATCSEGCQ